VVINCQYSRFQTKSWVVYINCCSKNGVRIFIIVNTMHALITKCNIFCRELMMWTAVLNGDSLTCNPFVWYLCVWYFGSSVILMYVVGEGKVLCDALCEFKLLDCLNLLLFVQHTYNLDLYKVQRSAVIILEKERNQVPLSVTQIFTLLGQWRIKTLMHSLYVYACI
jgi:hypothetical protein